MLCVLSTFFHLILITTQKLGTYYPCIKHWKTDIRSYVTYQTLEKVMATHSSILAWRIPWTEEPHGLQSMGSQRVVHN